MTRNPCFQILRGSCAFLTAEMIKVLAYPLLAIGTHHKIVKPFVEIFDAVHRSISSTVSGSRMILFSCH